MGANPLITELVFKKSGPRYGHEKDVPITEQGNQESSTMLINWTLV